MKRYLSLFISALLIVTLCSCSKGTDIDTGIPDVKMKISETAETKTEDFTGGSQTKEYNADGQLIKVTRYIADKSAIDAIVEMENFISYHKDGRVYQNVAKHYKDGVLDSVSAYQYDYDDSAQQVSATVWEKHGNATGTDTVVHTLTEENGEAEITGIYSDYGEEYVTVKIRRISEVCSKKSVHTDYIAGKVTNIDEWYFSSESHTEKQDFSTGEVIETAVPGVFIHIADTVRTEENMFENGAKYLRYYDAEDRCVKLEDYSEDGAIKTAKYTAYDEQGRRYSSMDVEYKDGNPDKTYLALYDYAPDSLDVKITYGIVWGSTFASDTVEYTMEQPDSRIHIGGSGYSGTENYFTVQILAICERRDRDFEKWTNYNNNGEITGVDRQEYRGDGVETEHSVTVSAEF